MSGSPYDYPKEYDVIVVGGGHAGCEAALAAAEGLPPEFPAADVREAAGALAELLGEVAPEEVLDAIFGSFCIGK